MTNLSFEKSRHLTVRTGYGPELEKIVIYQRTTQQQAIEDLLLSPRDYFLPPPKVSSAATLKLLRKSKKRKALAGKRFVRDSYELKQWGLKQAITNPNALQERMTWFWHNHFTSSHRKSRRTLNLMLNQDLSIRRNALGNFADLLHDMAYDPMMLIYLDGVANKKGQPNENFARELLELFTLGEGHYSEHDIKEVARAFAGWGISGKTQLASLRRKHADTGQKTIFNQTGIFSSDDVLGLLLNHPRTAEFIAEKFWKEFINLDQPDPATIRSWAQHFRSNNYDITALLRIVLNSPAFWSPNNRATLIKSPLDLVVGALRSLDLEDKNLPLRSVLGQLRGMGQDIYTPPNVKGWVGGKLWINDVTLPVRQRFLRMLGRGSQNQKNTIDMNKKNGSNLVTGIPRLPAEQWGSWLLPMKSVTSIEKQNPRKRLQAILLDPAFQLK